MFEKTKLDEVHGTITDVYNYSVSNGGTTTAMKNGITIQPDDPERGKISEAFAGVDYSQFSVGQRVVNVSYTWKRPATVEDVDRYSRIGRECPDEVDDYEYVTYDELSYDQEKQSSNKR